MVKALRILGCVVAACLLAPFLAAQEDVHTDPLYGRVKLDIPEPTENGSWYGTWIYANSEARYALWLRDGDDGRPEVRVRYVGTKLTPESFLTEWDGRSEYFVQGAEAVFELAIDEGDANEATGRWDWELHVGNSSREEHAEVRLYRTGDGRNLVLHFEPFRRVISRGGAETVQDLPRVWTFRKVSRRLAPWEELPL